MRTLPSRRACTMAAVLLLRTMPAAATETAVGCPPSAETEQTLATLRARVRDGEIDAARTALRGIATCGARETRAVAWFELADAAERAFRYGDALDAYRQVLAADPGHRFAARAELRIAYFTARAEGDFEPLQTLDRIRHDPERVRDTAALRALATAAERWPVGRVRTEAWLVAADGWVHGAGDPAEGLALLDRIATDPSTPTEIRRSVHAALAELREARGEYAVGLAEQRGPGGIPEAADRFRTLLRRETLARIAACLAAAYGLAALVAAFRLARAQGFGRVGRDLARPMPWVQLALLTLGGGGLAHTWNDHGIAPFVVLGAATAGVYAATVVLVRAGSRSVLARAVRLFSATAAMVCVTFLVMYGQDPRMLEGIGL